MREHAWHIAKLQNIDGKFSLDSFIATGVVTVWTTPSIPANPLVARIIEKARLNNNKIIVEDN